MKVRVNQLQPHLALWVVQPPEPVLWPAVLHEVVVEIALPLYDDGYDGAVDGELPEVLPGQPHHVSQPEHGAERVAVLVVGAGGEVLAVGGLQDVGAAGAVQGELDLRRKGE